MVERATIFISYSHHDARWLERIRVHLKSLEREHPIDIWDDSKISPGLIWKEEIEKAIKLAKVAVLLVSADFLASDFIATNELPPLLHAAKEDGALILPVIVGPSRFSTLESLSQFQAINHPLKPLNKMPPHEREEVYFKIAKCIEDWLKSGGSIDFESSASILTEPSKLIITNTSPIQVQRISVKASRKWVTIGGSLLLTTLVAFAILFLRKEYWSPIINGINPVAPIANARLEIYGENFPETADELKVLFNNYEAKEIYTVNTRFIEVRVPEEVVSGPLRVIKKSYIHLLPDLEADYFIVSVQRLDRDIVLINEVIDINSNHMSVGFSIINTTNSQFTLNDIRLQTLLLKDLGTFGYKQERINLGIYSILKGRKTDMEFLEMPSASLLGKQYVVKLEPRSSESFSFRIRRPDSPANLHFIFAVSAHFFDANGKQGIAYANRLYNVNVSDLRGFVALGDLPLTQETLLSLQSKYKEEFHSIDLRTP